MAAAVFEAVDEGPREWRDLDIRVIPRAGRSGFAGLRDGALIVKLAAAPVDGAANDELIALLAKTLRVPCDPSPLALPDKP